jgi:hypothetical protein
MTRAAAARRFQRLGVPREEAQQLADQAVAIKGTLARRLAAVWKLGRKLAVARGRR